jgi:RNA polymerase sigma-70 factor (ECF subfamily)
VALTAIDRNLLSRCLNREPGAWKDFVDRFMGLIVHVIQHTAESRNQTLSDADVDDLCADVLLAIVANDFAVLRHFRGQSSLATYLTVVARRICARVLFTRARGTARMEHAESVASQRPDAQQQVADRDQVTKMLEGLEGAEAEIVRLFHLQGKSYREISSELGVAENTIGPILSRARAKMRRTAGQEAR